MSEGNFSVFESPKKNHTKRKDKLKSLFKDFEKSLNILNKSFNYFTINFELQIFHLKKGLFLENNFLTFWPIEKSNRWILSRLLMESFWNNYRNRRRFLTSFSFCFFDQAHHRILMVAFLFYCGWNTNLFGVRGRNIAFSFHPVIFSIGWFKEMTSINLR